MKKLAVCKAVSLGLLLSAGCGGDKKNKKGKDDKIAAADAQKNVEAEKNIEAENQAEEKTAEPADAPKPAVFAMVRHKVEDFDKWKTAFDGHEEARIAAGSIAHYLYRDAADESFVIVGVAGGSIEKAQEFLGSDDLKNDMKEAGVVGEPEIWLFEPGDSKAAPEGAEPQAHAFIIHKVKDYDPWKKAFDDHDAKRVEAGIIGHDLGRAVGDENTIGIHFSLGDQEKAKAFIESEDLKKVMADAGVEGKPTILMANPVETKTYETKVARK